MTLLPRTFSGAALISHESALEVRQAFNFAVELGIEIDRLGPLVAICSEGKQQEEKGETNSEGSGKRERECGTHKVFLPLFRFSVPIHQWSFGSLLLLSVQWLNRTLQVS